MSTQQLIFAVIYFAFGAGLVFLSFLIIRDSVRIRLNRVTSAMIFLAGLGPIFAALGEVISPYQAASPLKESYIYNLFYIWELFFPVLVYFSWIFPFDRLGEKFSKWRLLIFIPHIFHIVLLVFVSDTDKLLDLLTFDSSSDGLIGSIIAPVSEILKLFLIPLELILTSHRKFFALINLAYVILAVVYLYRGMKYVEAPRLKKQVRVIILGIHASLGLYIFTFILPNLFSIEISELWTSLLTILSLVIGAGAIAWAIIRYQFLDIRLIVRQSLVYTVSSAILVGAYVIAITRLSSLIESFIGKEMPIVNIGFIIFALIFFQPINNYIDNIIKRMFIRDRSDYRNIINRLSSKIINILDRDQLISIVEETLRNSMLVQGVTFCIYDDERQAYLYLPRDNDQEGTALSNTDPMLGAIGQLNTPTFYDRLHSWHRGSPLASMLQADAAHLIVPLNDREHLLGFIVLTDKSSGFKFSYEDFTLLSTLANQLVVALSNVRLYRESLVKQRLEEEMNLARQIQINLLPDTPPAGNGFSIVAHSKPSRTVGGDFYDFVKKSPENSIGMVIADVSGKGMPAALLAAQIQATLRSEVGNNRPVCDTIAKVNNIVANLSSSSGKYATLFYGEYHPDTREFEFSNAGHNFPVLIRADGSHEFLETGGTVIGAFEQVQYESLKVKMGPDDLLFLYTDGLSEAMNLKEEEYGEERIIEYLKAHRTRPLDELKSGILHEVDTFTAAKTAEDDTTIVILKVSGDESHE